MTEDLERIPRIFAERFAAWAMELPKASLEERRSGQIRQSGWRINYTWGTEADDPYLEYYATHRMTSDSRERIYQSGKTSSLPSIQSFFAYDPEEPGSEQAARDKYFKHNQRIGADLRRLGLFPEDDINAHLHTNPDLAKVEGSNGDE